MDHARGCIIVHRTKKSLFSRYATQQTSKHNGDIEKVHSLYIIVSCFVSLVFCMHSHLLNVAVSPFFVVSLLLLNLVSLQPSLSHNNPYYYYYYYYNYMFLPSIIGFLGNFVLFFLRHFQVLVDINILLCFYHPSSASLAIFSFSSCVISKYSSTSTFLPARATPEDSLRAVSS